LKRLPSSSTYHRHLEKAGVDFDKKGITVDAHLKSSNKKIFAVGDVAGGPQFTHVAGYHAGIIIRQICSVIKHGA